MSKTRQVFLHSTIWIIILLSFLVLAGSGKVTYQNVVMIVYFGLINITIFYINYLLILPRFFNTKKYLWFGASLALLIISTAFIKYGLATLYSDFVLQRGPKKEYHISFTDFFVGALFVSWFFIFLSTALKFMVDWFINEKVRSNLENEKLTAELAFLKSQLNPHFLFNSLNNIYSLSYQKSEKTPEAILKLSEMMRYMLYESNDNSVELSKEITYLKNYIDLQKLRFKNGAFVNMVIDGDTDGKLIMPMVLVSFVENAFKHGVASDEQNPILIAIRIWPQKLYFKVSNKIANLNKDETGGVGLANVKRRLDLLYKGRYRLQIHQEPDQYTCELYLDL